MTFVIVGAGPTGSSWPAKSASSPPAASHATSAASIRRSVRVIVVDGGKEPLANFGHQLSGRARADLEKMGVQFQMGLRVVGVDPFGVDTLGGDDEKGRLSAAPSSGPPGSRPHHWRGLLAEATGAETDRAGRIAVRPDLSLPGHPEVFAIGDMAALNDLPGVCEVAMQGGLHAANTIKRRLKGSDSVPFKYRDLGSAAAIGRFKAIVSVGPVRLSGFPGFIVWMFVHLAFLSGFGHRFTTLLRWGRAMIGRARPERVFSVGHTGGDLSLPDEVKAKVMPKPFPVLEDQVGWAELVARVGAPGGGDSGATGGTVPA